MTSERVKQVWATHLPWSQYTSSPPQTRPVWWCTSDQSLTRLMNYIARRVYCILYSRHVFLTKPYWSCRSPRRPMTLSKCGVQLLHSKLDNTEDPCTIVSLSGAEGKVFLVRVEQLKTPGRFLFLIHTAHWWLVKAWKKILRRILELVYLLPNPSPAGCLYQLT